MIAEENKPKSELKTILFKKFKNLDLNGYVNKSVPSSDIADILLSVGGAELKIYLQIIKTSKYSKPINALSFSDMLSGPAEYVIKSLNILDANFIFKDDVEPVSHFKLLDLYYNK